MSSVHHLREFIGERLTAAASEIFSEFEKTILRYEEEIDRQRRLLDVSWKPEVKLHRVDLRQTHKTELSLTDQPFDCQDRNSSLDLEEPERQPLQNQEKEPKPPQIKEEEQEDCVTNQEEGQLLLKQETDPFPVTEPDKEQLISQSSAGLEDHDSGSDENTEWSPTKTDHTHGRHGNKVDQPATSVSFSCKICGETFLENSLLSLHIQVHKVWSQNSERLQYCCPTCGYSAPLYYLVVNHMRTHTGEKTFSCKICGNMFSTQRGSRIHMRRHTGERPFVCQICGKAAISSSHIRKHMKVHTGEKTFSCRFCGKTFNYSSNWKRHLSVHTGEQPYSCLVCGKRFKRSTHVNRHMKVHADRGDVLSREGEKLENP